MARYQRGSLALKKRANGRSTWEFRWRNASGTQLSKLLGSFPSEREAQCAADVIRLEINAELPKAVPITFATMVDRYLCDSVEMARLSFATRNSYKTYFNVWAKPKWGNYQLEQVRAVAVERWLHDLPLADKSKLHLRNVLHVLYECAARWDIIQENPISRVRQGGQRAKEPELLTSAEFRALLAELTTQPYRLMVILAGCLGLSRSEFTGLQWGDVLWDEGILRVRRSVVNCHEGEPKTSARRKPMPLVPELLTILREHRECAAYAGDSDWIFASPYKTGLAPYWPDSALAAFVKPALRRAGITKAIGWHSFRHAYSSLLRTLGIDIKVQSELLRHSNVMTTLDIYTQAPSEQKRIANGQVAGQLLTM